MSDTHGENVRPTALTYSRMYESKRCEYVERHTAIDMACPWISKIGCYETPFAVTGGKVLLGLGTGLEEAPKSI